MVYLLEKDGELLARMPLLDMEMFAIHCAFQPTPAFKRFRTLFEEDNRIFRLLEQQETPELLDLQIESDERLQKLGLTIRTEDGSQVYDQSILSIDGDRADFRPLDEA